MVIPRVILLIEASRAYGRGLLRGIARYSRLNGPWTFLGQPVCHNCCGHDVVAGGLRGFANLGADGIIAHALDEPIAGRIMAAHIPIIAEGTRDTIPGVVNIVCDDAAIGRMAAEHLLDRGFRHLAYCGLDFMPWSVRRCSSFCERVEQAGFEVFIYRQRRQEESAWDAEQKELADWLRSLPRPVGVMACNDNRGRHLAEVCKVAGIRVPEEVAIVGVDDDSLVCELCDPALSSIALNCEKAGYQAAEALDRLMNGRDARDKVIVNRPTHVVVRQSTEILAIDDSEVAHAVHFIRQHCASPIQVIDVVEAVAVSRRSLESRFRKVMRRSIHDEITRVRVAEIARMLVQTDLPISKIGQSLHFSTTDHICRYFRSEMKVTPATYRRQHAAAH